MKVFFIPNADLKLIGSMTAILFNFPIIPKVEILMPNSQRWNSKKVQD